MSGSIQAITLGGALLTWSAVVYKGLSLWRAPANPAAWAYWAGFLALALNMTLLMPPITSWIDGMTGISGLTYLLCDAAALLTCWIWLVCLHQLNGPDPQTAALVRRFGTVIVAALAFFSLRFAIAPGQVQHRFGTDPQGLYLAAYRLLFVGIIAAHMASFIMLLRRYAAEVQRPTLRLRLHFMMVAAGLVIGFAINESLRILQFPSPEVIGALFLLAAVLAMVVGLTFSHRLDRLFDLVRQYRLQFQLYPLWQALYPVNPSLSFLDEPSPLRRIVPRDDLEFIICRQVIEIRDWALVLRPFRQPGPTQLRDTKANLGKARDDDRAASIEGLQLAAALRSWRQRGRDGESASLPSSPRQASRPATTRSPETADWRQEARYLARVACHFTRSSCGASDEARTPRQFREGNTH